jgi:hypothetical protein
MMLSFAIAGVPLTSAIDLLVPDTNGKLLTVTELAIYPTLFLTQQLCRVKAKI